MEGAILGAVGASAKLSRILLGGAEAAGVDQVLREYGLRTRFYSAEIGPASAFKMIRSVFSKGMETLLIETLVAARRAGLLDEVWDEIKATLAPEQNGADAGNLDPLACRQFRTPLLRNARSQRIPGRTRVRPLLGRAAAEMFRRSNELRIAAAFKGEPERFEDVIEYLEMQSRSTSERGME